MHIFNQMAKNSGFYSLQVNKWASEGLITVKSTDDRDDCPDSGPPDNLPANFSVQVSFSRSSHT